MGDYESGWFTGLAHPAGFWLRLGQLSVWLTVRQLLNGSGQAPRLYFTVLYSIRDTGAKIQPAGEPTLFIIPLT